MNLMQKYRITPKQVIYTCSCQSGDWGKTNKKPISQSGEKGAALSPPDVKQSPPWCWWLRGCLHSFCHMLRPKNFFNNFTMRGYNSLWIHRCSTMQPPCYPSGKNTNTSQPSIFIFFYILQGSADCMLIIFDRFTLYSKSEKSRPPLPPLNPPLNPGGAPRGGPNEPLLSGRPRPPRGPMKPRPRKPPLPRLCLRGMPKVSEFIRLSSAQVDLRSLTHTKTDQDPFFGGKKHNSTKKKDM